VRPIHSKDLRTGLKTPSAVHAPPQSRFARTRGTIEVAIESVAARPREETSRLIIRKPNPRSSLNNAGKLNDSSVQPVLRYGASNQADSGTFPAADVSIQTVEELVRESDAAAW